MEKLKSLMNIDQSQDPTVNLKERISGRFAQKIHAMNAGGSGSVIDEDEKENDEEDT